MIKYFAYLYDKDLDTYEMKVPFLVHSCGKITFNKNKNMRIDRQNGRKDYQIIYIHRGKGHFWLKEQECVLEEGSIVVYYPDERQRYSFYYSENSEFYWIHFSGTRVPELLKESGFDSHANVGMATQIANGFEEVIRELMIKRRKYMELANLKGEGLIYLLIRENYEQQCYKNKAHQAELEKIIEEINLHYAEPLLVEELAETYGTSVEWFIKTFSNYTGATPKQYINEIRLNHAKELLSSTDYNIGEIAQACGFENPLYFSKYFKKKYQISPSEYRSDLQRKLPLYSANPT